MVYLSHLTNQFSTGGELAHKYLQKILKYCMVFIIMSEQVTSHSEHFEQLQLLFMSPDAQFVLERLGFDPKQYELTPENYNLGYPLVESRPRGLDITNTQSGKRLYITGYTDSQKEEQLQTAFNVHNSNPDRQSSYPFFVLERTINSDPRGMYTAYHLPKGIMPYYNAIYSPLISDEESKKLEGYAKTFKTFNIFGLKIRPSEFTTNDIAILLKDPKDETSTKRGIYKVPYAYFILERNQ